MSANNWTQCPKCVAAEKERQTKAVAKSAKSYGKVDPDKFLAMLEDQKPREIEDTMREDYELGVDSSGDFYVSYRCSCNKCDFEFRYKHECNAMAQTPLPVS